MDEADSPSVALDTLGGDPSLRRVRGGVVSSIPLEDEAKAEGRTTGRLGAGTGTLDVSAVTGDVQLRMRSTTAV